MQLFGLITSAHYLNDQTSIPKAGSLHLAFEYVKNPAHHHLFVQMLQILPALFSILVKPIKNHPIFHNNSNCPQASVDFQLAVTLY